MATATDEAAAIELGEVTLPGVAGWPRGWPAPAPGPAGPPPVWGATPAGLLEADNVGLGEVGGRTLPWCDAELDADGLGVASSSLEFAWLACVASANRQCVWRLWGCCCTNWWCCEGDIIGGLCWGWGCRPGLHWPMWGGMWGSWGFPWGWGSP